MSPIRKIPMDTAVQCTDGNTLRIWCGELTDLTL